MPLILQPFKLNIQPGGKINVGTILITRDKTTINQSATSNGYNTGEACIMISNSFAPAFSFGTLGNTIIDDDLIDKG